jgi:hypothetical protein
MNVTCKRASALFLAALLSIGFSAIVQTAKAQTLALAPEATFPKRKPGLWQIRGTGLEQAGMAPTFFCVGEGTDTDARHLDRKAGVLGACSLGAFKPAQGGWVAESICKDSKTTVKSQAVLTGDLSLEYRIDTLVSYLPPIAGTRKTDQDSLTAKYLGNCSVTQKPGDLVVPGMGTLNLDDGSFRAEAIRKPAKSAKKQRPN